MNDALMLEYVDGNPRAFRRLAHELEPRLRRYVRRYVRRRVRSPDVADRVVIGDRRQGSTDTDAGAAAACRGSRCVRCSRA